MTISLSQYKELISKKPKFDGYSKKATVTIGGKTFRARSSWESNIAAYFQFLKENGDIKEWEYEIDTFWFLKIKRGVRSYMPDIKIWRNNGTFYYVEIKGYMDAKSKTKLNRMRIYYPEIEIQLIDEARYKSIKKNSSVIPNWGLIK